MAEEPEQWVERSFEEPHITFRCDCGWEGHDADVAAWDVQFDSDRVVRICPNCGDPTPEWGAVRTIEGAARIAVGPLRTSLENAGVL